MKKYISIISLIAIMGCQSTQVEDDVIKSNANSKEYSLIKFKKNKHSVKGRSELIDNSINILAHHKDKQLNAKGRASEEGSTNYNLKLSGKRIESVKQAITKKIKSDTGKRISYEAHGESKQINKGLKRQKETNRSVEVAID